MISLMHSECFVADAMLGRLVRWLRVMGIDVLYDPPLTDAHLLQYAEREGRVLLTRDRHLANKQGPARRLLIESAYYHEQVGEVVRAFQLAGRTAVFSRCIRCNTPLQPVSRDLVAGKVPAYVFATQMTSRHVMCAIGYTGVGHTVIICSDSSELCLATYFRPTLGGPADAPTTTARIRVYAGSQR